MGAASEFIKRFDANTDSRPERAQEISRWCSHRKLYWETHRALEGRRKRVELLRPSGAQILSGCYQPVAAPPANLLRPSGANTDSSDFDESVTESQSTMSF